MQLIVSVDQNWGIGKQGDLLLHVKEDMRFFRNTTLGKAVVMGRSTLESLPGSKPLNGRYNYVISHNPSLQIEGATVCHSMDEALETIGSLPENDIFIIGGASLYHAFLEYCTIAYITKFHTCVEGVDRYFPNLDVLPNWQIISETEPQEEQGISFSFCVYQNATPLQNPYKSVESHFPI